MNNIFLSSITAAAIATVSSLPAMADSFGNEPTAMLYYSIPFDGNSRHDEINTYGFRVDNFRTDPREGINFNSLVEKKPQMDMRFTREGIQAWEFNGVNTLVQTTVYNAAEGTTHTATTVNWGLVAIGVIGVAALLEGQDDDGDDCPVDFLVKNKSTIYDKVNRIALPPGCEPR